MRVVDAPGHPFLQQEAVDGLGVGRRSWAGTFRATGCPLASSVASQTWLRALVCSSRSRV
jgi:hypothetical protein